MKNIRIVRPDIEPDAMSEMINKFRFEMGITPTMVGKIITNKCNNEVRYG